MNRFHKFKSASRAVLTLVVLAGVLGSVSAFAQKPINERTVIDEQYLAINPCNGEELQVSDTWQIITSMQLGKDGCERYKTHINNMGTSAVGSSGARYQISAAVNSRSEYCDGCTLEIAEEVTFTYAGQGGAPNFKMRAMIRVTINFCENTTVIKRQTFSTTCDNDPL